MTKTNPSDRAVIQLQGKQYLVAVGDRLVVDRLDHEPGHPLTIPEVLWLQSADQIQVGQPIVKNAAVIGQVLDHQLGEKILVFKYKSKSRYRRSQGHRQQQSVVEVTAIKS